MLLPHDLCEKIERQNRLLHWAQLRRFSQKERLLSDPAFRLRLYGEAVQADQHGEPEVARQLRQCLDIKLVEEP